MKTSRASARDVCILQMLMKGSKTFTTAAYILQSLVKACGSSRHVRVQKTLVKASDVYVSQRLVKAGKDW